MTLEEIVQQKLDRLQTVPDEFYSVVERSQKQVYKAILKELEGLEISGGRLINIGKEGERNVAKIESIVNKMQSVLFQGEYLEGIKSFATEFQTQAFLNNSYFEKTFADFQISDLYGMAVKQAQVNAVELVAQDAIAVNFAAPLRQMLSNSILTGSSFGDAVSTLNEFIIGNPEMDGKLLSYSKRVVRDAFSTADRNYSKTIADDLGVEFYLYQGGTVKDSRPFCIERHGHYYHQKEIESWASEQWQGKNVATNKFTIFSLCGGYNCMHGLMPVPVSGVQKSDIARAKAKGFYKE